MKYSYEILNYFMNKKQYVLISIIIFSMIFVIGNVINSQNTPESEIRSMPSSHESEPRKILCPEGATDPLDCYDSWRDNP